MSTMLPFTSTDLLFAVVAVGALLVLSAVVYALARLQQPAGRSVMMIPVEPDGVTASAAPSPAGSPGTVQHA